LARLRANRARFQPVRRRCCRAKAARIRSAVRRGSCVIWFHVMRTTGWPAGRPTSDRFGG